ncbi:MmgE/PrpD family protein [Ensifer soli]|uniref:MmgE/PrpD family protein n=1 Tax=Ciceribacter sp. sgz301302 TaxID=3342379 RepID=UPI0035B7325D
MADSGVSRQLARFVTGSRWQDIPEETRRQASLAVLNVAATGLAGARDVALRRLGAALAPFSGPATSTVIGAKDRRDAPTAAFLNAAAMNVHDFDDTHEGTIIHPSAPVAAALMAVAETMPMTGADFLHAFVLGTEVECRIGNAISPGHYDRGWHITSTCGVFGAAVAVGTLLRLDEDQVLSALGNASAQAGGLVETLGFMAKSISVGNAARNGLLSALMAKAGVEGPPRPLEGPRGFLTVSADTVDLDALTRDLGITFELSRNALKLYPCGVVLMPVIDACLALRDQVDPAAIDSVVITGHPLLKARTDRPAIVTGREAQVSAQHAAAASLLRGSAGLDDFSDAAVNDPAVASLRARVQPVAVDPACPVERAEVLVRLADGRECRHAIDAARGSLANPATVEDIERKFRTLAAWGCPDVNAERALQTAHALEHLDDAADLPRALKPAR